MLRLVQITPAAPGWRTVEALLGFKGDPRRAKTASLIAERAIACFALVENERDTNDRCVLPVTAQDWPSYLCTYGGSDEIGFGASRMSSHIDILGPGEPIETAHIEAARERIVEYRKAEAEAKKLT